MPFRTCPDSAFSRGSAFLTSFVTRSAGILTVAGRERGVGLLASLSHTRSSLYRATAPRSGRHRRKSRFRHPANVLGATDATDCTFIVCGVQGFYLCSVDITSSPELLEEHEHLSLDLYKLPFPCRRALDPGLISCSLSARRRAWHRRVTLRCAVGARAVGVCATRPFGDII